MIPEHNTGVAARNARKSERNFTGPWGGARNEIRFYPHLRIEV